MSETIETLCRHIAAIGSPKVSNNLRIMFVTFGDGKSVIVKRRVMLARARFTLRYIVCRRWRQ